MLPRQDIGSPYIGFVRRINGRNHGLSMEGSCLTKKATSHQGQSNIPVEHAAGGVNVVVKGPITVRDQVAVDEDEDACTPAQIQLTVALYEMSFTGGAFVTRNERSSTKASVALQRKVG